MSIKHHLIAFKTGHYKSFNGEWLGNSMWDHFKKTNGNMVHINPAEIEYIEVSDAKKE